MKFIFDDFELVPYTRTTQRGKWIVPKAIKYQNNQHALAWLYKQQMVNNGWEKLPYHAPLYVRMTVTRQDVYRCDLDNLLKAALDAAKDIVLDDDRYVVKILETEKRRGRGSLEIEIGLVADL